MSLSDRGYSHYSFTCKFNRTLQAFPGRTPNAIMIKIHHMAVFLLFNKQRDAGDFYSVTSVPVLFSKQRHNGLWTQQLFQFFNQRDAFGLHFFQGLDRCIRCHAF